MTEPSIKIAVGTYEGSLLVYEIDLENGVHIPLFTSNDNDVSLKVFKLFREGSEPFTLQERVSSLVEKTS